MLDGSGWAGCGDQRLAGCGNQRLADEAKLAKDLGYAVLAGMELSAWFPGVSGWLLADWGALSGCRARMISAFSLGMQQFIWVQTSHTGFLRSIYAPDSSSGCISDQFYGSYRHIRLRIG